MHHNFYFDETFHDRKITIKPSGVINTFTENKNDSYVGVFWGCENTKRSSITKKLHILEDKYVKKYGLSGEFKSTNIAKKNFTYGIRSFNRDALEYFGDLFRMLESISPIIHVNAVSKIEFLIRNIFDIQILKQLPGVSPNAFYYSLTKFILTYHTPALIQAMYESAETGNGEIFQEELLNHMEAVVASIDGIVRKGRETPAVYQLHMIVSLFQFNNPINTKYDFIYFQNFDGLMKLLTERKISPKKVNLIIDLEENTYQAAKTFPFREVRQADSTNSVHVRLADQLCGFVGRMMHALMDDKLVKEDPVTDIDRLEENDLIRKRLLSPEWFDLKSEHFSLYKQVSRVLILQQEAYWATMTWSYCDQISVFYTLLRYIASYKSYEEYIKHTPKDHSEFFNSACCDDLERFYMTL